MDPSTNIASTSVASLPASSKKKKKYPLSPVSALLHELFPDEGFDYEDHQVSKLKNNKRSRTKQTNFYKPQKKHKSREYPDSPETCVCAYDPTTAFGIVAFMCGCFPQGIPRKIIFHDPVGTRFEIGMVYREGYLCFYDGWHTLGSYYDLYPGGWFELTYEDPSSMKMIVRNRKYDEVDYPTPAIYFALQKLPNPVTLLNSNDGSNCQKIFPKSCFHFVLTKWLTIPDLAKLVLPYTFCLRVLNPTHTSVTLMDDYGRPWFCSLEWYSKPVSANGSLEEVMECKVGGEWPNFSLLRLLKENQPLVFGFPEEFCGVLYVTLGSIPV